MRQNGERLPLAVDFLKMGQVALTGRIIAKETDGSFRESPFQMGVSDLVPEVP